MSPDIFAMMRLPWQWPLRSNGAFNIQQLWASGGRTREPILIKFGTQHKITTSMTVTWSNIKIFKILDGGRPPCWKILEIFEILEKKTRLPNGPVGTKLGWSNPIASPTCPPWRGCHGNGRCLATVHWIFGSYGRLEAEPILMKFGTQQRIRTSMGDRWRNIKI